jgi:predicted nucleotidyltransferase
MTDRLTELLQVYRSSLAGIYGERLAGVYVYGSYARGEAHRDSDVDVLIVLDEIPQYGAEIRRTSELTARLSLEYGVTLSRVFVSARDWAASESPFLSNVRDEAEAA